MNVLICSLNNGRKVILLEAANGVKMRESFGPKGAWSSKTRTIEREGLIEKGTLFATFFLKKMVCEEEENYILGPGNLHALFMFLPEQHRPWVPLRVR